jgi:hypothetical protein
MNTDLIAEFDAAVQTLDALGAASLESPNSIEARLNRDIVDLRLHGLESWHPRWIHGPLRAVRAIEGLRLKLMVEAEDVKHELRELQAQISLLREAGRVADAEFASRPAVRLLCHEADIRERLNAPVSHLIATARNGIARILEVSLRYAGHEAMRLANECSQPGADPALLEEAFQRADGYNKLVAEAHRVTGGLDVPIYPPDQVTRLRALHDARSKPQNLTRRIAALADADTLVSVKVDAAFPPRAAGATAPAAPEATSLAAGTLTVPAAVEGRPKDAPKTRPSLPRLRGVIAGVV